MPERMRGENELLKCDQVCEILKCSPCTGYKVIRELNEELSQKGYYVLTGKVSRRYLMERFFGTDND